MTSLLIIAFIPLCIYSAFYVITHQDNLETQTLGILGFGSILSGLFIFVYGLYKAFYFYDVKLIVISLFVACLFSYCYVFVVKKLNNSIKMLIYTSYTLFFICIVLYGFLLPYNDI